MSELEKEVARLADQVRRQGVLLEKVSAYLLEKDSLGFGAHVMSGVFEVFQKVQAKEEQRG